MKQKYYEIGILWGECPEPDDEPTYYRFKTKGIDTSMAKKSRIKDSPCNLCNSWFSNFFGERTCEIIICKVCKE